VFYLNSQPLAQLEFGFELQHVYWSRLLPKSFRPIAQRYVGEFLQHQLLKLHLMVKPPQVQMVKSVVVVVVIVVVVVVVNASVESAPSLMKML